MDNTPLIADSQRSDAEDAVPQERVNETALKYTTIGILSALMLEVLLRIVYLDLWGFLRDLWNIFDFIHAVAVRIRRLGDRVATGSLPACGLHALQNRRRFEQDGFDLDITYITERILAMSVPAVSVEALYRNPVTEVARFFNSKYPGRYRIFCLCPERSYPHAPFQNRVTEYYMADHNPTSLAEILRFCDDAHGFLTADPANVIAVHCKGGKGRTGTMVCAYLLYSGLFQSAPEALRFFAQRRTAGDDGQEAGKGQAGYQGVEAKSQERFVHYFQAVVYDFKRTLPPPRTLTFLRIRVFGVQHITPAPWHLWFILMQGGPGLPVIYDQSLELDRRKSVSYNARDGYADFFPSSPVRLAQDIRVAFYMTHLKKKEKKDGAESGGGGEGKRAKTPAAASAPARSAQSSLAVNFTDRDEELGGGSPGPDDMDDGKTSPFVDSDALAVNGSQRSMTVAAPQQPKSKGHKPKHKQEFGFWLHTSFVARNPFRLRSEDIDGGGVASKTQFHPDFAVEVHFDRLTAAPGPASSSSVPVSTA